MGNILTDIQPRRRLQDCPGASPFRWHLDIVSACGDKCVNDGLLPDEFEMNVGYASTAGLNVVEEGCVVVSPHGGMDMILDVTLPPRRFAWVFLHESAETAYQLRHPDVRFQRIADRVEWQRRIKRAHEQTVIYADLAILAPRVQRHVLAHRRRDGAHRHHGSGGCPRAREESRHE